MSDTGKRETDTQLTLTFEDSKPELRERAGVTSIEVVRLRRDRRILIEQLARTGIFREPSTTK